MTTDIRDSLTEWTRKDETDELIEAKERIAHMEHMLNAIMWLSMGPDQGPGVRAALKYAHKALTGQS